MEDFFIEETQTTPEISFCFNKGQLEIKGVCFPEYPEEFYRPLMKYFDTQIATSDLKKIVVSFKLTYFNTGTNPIIAELLKVFEKLQKKHDKIILIQWFYEEGDDEMKEVGEYFKTLTSIPFNFIAVDEIL
ncbi:MAG: DUF1987 domain-containing protein [Microscillaceae bacterium]|nr:DUF1987 domain-containing protein [Microscillaceae bacterium]MDW8459687.1 DUF1987 domain-containing protein [Cytophagales bacterium]